MYYNRCVQLDPGRYRLRDFSVRQIETLNLRILLSGDIAEDKILPDNIWLHTASAAYSFQAQTARFSVRFFALGDLPVE